MKRLAFKTLTMRISGIEDSPEPRKCSAACLFAVRHHFISLINPDEENSVSVVGEDVKKI
jgi:hypothetical protein